MCIRETPLSTAVYPTTTHIPARFPCYIPGRSIGTSTFFGYVPLGYSLRFSHVYKEQIQPVLNQLYKMIQSGLVLFALCLFARSAAAQWRSSLNSMLSKPSVSCPPVGFNSVPNFNISAYASAPWYPQKQVNTLW